MNEVFSSLYPRFRCIGSACRHNCCIGWEIDIDKASLSRYISSNDPLSDRLRREIDTDGTPHFRLKEGGRCPFLNGSNLCDIQLAQGEEALCRICRDHPRFRTVLPGRTEIGLGLCCEEAARLLVSEKAPIVLPGFAESLPAGTVHLLKKRQKLVAAAQDRRLSVGGRMRKILALSGGSLKKKSHAEWAEFLLSLEELEPTWSETVALLRSGRPDYGNFKVYMAGRETEYENLLVYFLYRHLLADGGKNTEVRAAFAVWCVGMIYAVGAVKFTENGSFSPQEQAELARLWSAGIEYSEENMKSVFLHISP